ncbi:MAG: hypothetical protein DCC68_10705 [Planctomycetota bacterium]|nr:MAG: hypothetical protein DCC68_10705 [Planctomycetota bacterium]
MKRSQTHQIDETARQVFESALPTTWVCNSVQRDYGKDYVVEIGDADGALSGDSFYVQLKGSTRLKASRDGSHLAYPLKTKHAIYYLDKLKDLPIFLVLVDTKSRCAWWLFIQEALRHDQTWRSRKTVTLYVPLQNTLSWSNFEQFRKAILSAKRFLRAAHPLSITEAIAAQKEHKQLLDTRFNVSVTLDDEVPRFHFSPKEDVTFKVRFKGSPENLQGKLAKLIDQGVPVSFAPGEVFAEGTRLFDELTNHGGTMQWAVNIPASLVLSCADNGVSVTVQGIQGAFQGGQREHRFLGSLQNSPLSVSAGPFTPADNGGFNLNFKPTHWDGQRLQALAHFDNLLRFFNQLTSTNAVVVRFERNGNLLSELTARLQSHEFARNVVKYLSAIDKARKLAKRFHINPIWSFKAFDDEECDTANEAFGVLFEGEWVKKVPYVRLEAELVLIKKRNQIPRGPAPAQIVSSVTYTLLGERIEAGRIVREYSALSIELSPHATTRKARWTKKTVTATFTGTGDTTMRVRLANPDDE